MNMAIFDIVDLVWNVWKFGAHIGWKFLGVFIILLSTGQLLWQFWRWIDDAEEREEGNDDKDDYISQNERHRVLYGNLFKGWPWEVDKCDTVAWWAFVILASGVIAAVAIALWPILITVVTIYGLGQAARGFRRLHKIVAKMMKSLKGKADKDHNHKGKYQEVD